VVEVFDNVEKTTYALKIFKKFKHFEREVDTLLALNHPNIISFYGRADHLVNSMAIKLELGMYGDLYGFLRKAGRFPTSITRFIFRRLVQGLSYLHERNTYHRDVKPENIILCNNFEPKLTDFVVAKVFPEGKSDLCSSVVGTVTYMAPEIRAHLKYDGEKADVFAAGVTLFAIYTGKFPFHEATPNDKYYSFFVSGDLSVYFKAFENTGRILGEDFKDLISGMLAYDPASRMSMESVMKHPFYCGEEAPHERYIDFMRRVHEDNGELQGNWACRSGDKS